MVKKDIKFDYIKDLCTAQIEIQLQDELCYNERYRIPYMI